MWPASSMCHAGVKRSGTRKWPQTCRDGNGSTRVYLPARMSGVYEQWSYREDINTTTTTKSGVRTVPRPQLWRELSCRYRPDRNVLMWISTKSLEKSDGRGWFYRPENIDGVFLSSILHYLYGRITSQLMYVIWTASVLRCQIINSVW